MKNPRRLVVELLNKTFQNGGYSNIQLSNGLETSDMDERDKKLCSMLYYGVIERKITLDYIIGQFYKKPIDKLDISVINILRSGIYQLIYVDNIPDNAAVNESVKLAGVFRKKSASGLINAILRNFIRQGKQYALPKDIIISSMVKYSAPKWLIKSLISDYGIEKADVLLSNALEKPPLTIRLNSLKKDSINTLNELEATAFAKIPFCYEIKGTDVTSLSQFKDGMFHVQDKASQLCCMALNPTSEDRVLDICSAPGGKAFTMAEMMENKGELLAFDLHEKRVNLIKNGAKRLGIENIKADTADATIFNPELKTFTKILCDVPCSGLGVIRRKPEIKYKDISDFNKLPEIQYKIFENALKYLEVGGEIVYSTCTLRKAENEDVVNKILQNHPELESISLFKEPLLGFDDINTSMISIFPDNFNSDGFFIAKLRRIR